MLEPAIPADEPQRLAALHELDILDTPPEDSFDRVTRLARQIMGVPIAAVSLIDTDRQWFKSIVGLDISETPRAASFCGHAIHSPDPFVVTNAGTDARFADNPLVCGDPKIAFYAGMPLHSIGGYRLGTLCAIGQEPKTPSAEQIEALRDLAAIVEQELALRRLSAIDPLTSLLNRRAFTYQFNNEIRRLRREQGALTLLSADLDHFKALNDNFGHAAGDEALRQIATTLREIARRPGDLIARMGGDEFAIVLSGCADDRAESISRDLISSVESMGIVSAPGPGGKRLSLSVGGVAVPDASRLERVAPVMRLSDRNLYAAKRAGRGCSSISHLLH